MKVYNIHLQHIYSGEIWQKSACLDHEELINQQIYNQIKSIGFTATDHPRIWKRNNQTVIVCLVDDILSCSTDYHSDLPYVFDPNTTIITDNYTLCPSQYQIIRLPDSFFGIYSYVPAQVNWQPERDFSFAVNRIDYRRFKLMLDLAWRTDLNQGYVNFNCLTRTPANPTGPSELLHSVENFQEMWAQVPQLEQEKFKKVYQRLESAMPLKNYNIEFEEINYKSYINIIVESYSSDNNVSVSEKIFRALATPAPWTVYSGRYTVAWLESIGFDCMRDIVDHNHYDRLKEVENKISIFNWKSLEIVKSLKELGVSAVKQRCEQAAQHNQKLLAEMKNCWDQDFPMWIETLPNLLAK